MSLNRRLATTIWHDKLNLSASIPTKRNFALDIIGTDNNEAYPKVRVLRNCQHLDAVAVTGATKNLNFETENGDDAKSFDNPITPFSIRRLDSRPSSLSQNDLRSIG